MAKNHSKSKGNKKKQREKKIKNKYRLIIFNDESFAERYSFRLTKMNVFVLIGSFVIVMVGLVYALIAYTPLKEYVIPEYPKLEEREKIIQNAIRTDSLLHHLQLYDQKLGLLYKILNDEELPQHINELVDSTENVSNIVFTRSLEDSLLRTEIQEYEALNVNFTEGSVVKNSKYANLYFHVPLQGSVLTQFSPEKNHVGTDIVAKKNSVVHAVLSGVVIHDLWSAEAGYVCIIQHSNNFVSVYKHNSALLKRAGDKVKAGEGIAIVGEAGSLSDEPYLHFELWHESKPVNSANYIAY